MKTIIACLTAALLCFSVANALQLLDPDLTVKVNNGIVPTNSNYTQQMSATIAFSTDSTTVANSMSEVLHVHSDTVGAIIVSAPFCDSYLGYQCLVPIPKYCLNKIHKSGTLHVSGVITPYGFDLNSLHCSFLPKS